MGFWDDLSNWSSNTWDYIWGTGASSDDPVKAADLPPYSSYEPEIQPDTSKNFPWDVNPDYWNQLSQGIIPGTNNATGTGNNIIFTVPTQPSSGMSVQQNGMSPLMLVGGALLVYMLLKKKRR